MSDRSFIVCLLVTEVASTMEVSVVSTFPDIKGGEVRQQPGGLSLKPLNWSACLRFASTMSADLAIRTTFSVSVYPLP